jgi:hypothetical protein
LWLWVGTADTTISPNNFTQAILEWTNVLDLSTTPTSTVASNGDQQGSGQLWNDSCGQTALEAWSLQGGGHAPTPTASTASAIVSYFGLDKTGPDESASCGGMDAGTTVPDASTGGKDASTTGMDASTGELDATTGGKDASTGELDATAVGMDAATVGLDATTVGLDASTGELDTGTAPGTDASIGVGTDASIGVATDASIGAGTDASTGLSPDGSIVAVGDAGVGTPGSDAGTTTGDNEDGTGSAAGCGCRMVPTNDRFGGMLLAPLGAAIGILARRRRRSRK